MTLLFARTYAAAVTRLEYFHPDYRHCHFATRYYSQERILIDAARLIIAAIVA